jgi:hypothetical protein
MATPKKKRIMRDFAIDEISAVTMPAQKGAKMVLMKRADPGVNNGIAILPPFDGGNQVGGGEIDITKLSAADIAELVLKGRYQMTTAAAGHSHLIDVTEDDKARGGGYTMGCQCTDSAGQYSYHQHPFVIGKGGEITIGMANGHTHDVMTLEAVKAAAMPAALKSSTGKEDDMDQKEVTKLRALADMNDAQKAHFGKLGAADQEAFIAMAPESRALAVATAVEKAAGDNPVVYTSRNGSEYRKSDDPRLVQMAKDRDADIAAAEVAKAAQLEAEAITLAKSWDFMGKPMEEKVANAKAILGASPEVRKASLEAIEAQRAAMAPLFAPMGARDGTVAVKNDAASAEEELGKMAADLASKANISEADALVKVLQTPAGSRLYSKANPRLNGHVH